MSQITEWFLEGKRILAEAEQICSQANTVAGRLRTGHQNATLHLSQNDFYYSAISQQLEILKEVANVAAFYVSRVDTIAAIITNEVSDSESQLEATVENLKSIQVADQLKGRMATERNHHSSSNGTSTSGTNDSSLKSTLYDFVSNESLSDMSKEILALKEALQSTMSVHASCVEEFKEKISRIDSDLRSLQARLNEVSSSETIDKWITDIEEILHDMAQILESFTCHYDLSSRALRITQGYENASDDSELDRIMDILVNDSQEMESVFTELLELRSAMEDTRLKLEQVYGTFKDGQIELQDLVHQVCQFKSSMVLQSPSNSVSSGMSASQSNSVSPLSPLDKHFIPRLLTEAVPVLRNLYHLKMKCDALSEYYREFIEAYYELLIEVDRRNTFLSNQEEKIQTFFRQLNEERNLELDRRDHFMERFAGFLPSDIWPDINTPPVQFSYRRNDPVPLADELKVSLDAGQSSNLAKRHSATSIYSKE